MAAASPAEAKPWRPSSNPWLIAVSVMLATFMEVLDTSIAAVALPYIAGSVSATNDEATWVLNQLSGGQRDRVAGQQLVRICDSAASDFWSPAS